MAESRIKTVYGSVGKIARKSERYRGFMALLVVITLGLIFSPRSIKTGWPVFITIKTQLDILFENAEYGILAAGMTLVILTGGIDLSVGSVLGMVSCAFGLMVIGYGMDPYLACLISVIIGAAAGAISGFLISRFRVQAFAATLAMMAAARGMAKYITGEIKVQPGAREWYAIQGDSPSFFVSMTKSIPGIGVKPVTLVFLFAIVIMWVVVRYSRFGRHLYAIGGNEEAARLSGIRVGLNKFMAYVFCGMLAGLAGICATCRLELGDTEAGTGYELDAIAAVVIGGTSLAGGRGGMMLTLMGALIIGYINKILSLNGITLAWRLMVKGAIIVLAVLIQKRRKT